MHTSLGPSALAGLATITRRNRKNQDELPGPSLPCVRRDHQGAAIDAGSSLVASQRNCVDSETPTILRTSIVLKNLFSDFDQTQHPPVPICGRSLPRSWQHAPHLRFRVSASMSRASLRNACCAFWLPVSPRARHLPSDPRKFFKTPSGAERDRRVRRSAALANRRR